MMGLGYEGLPQWYYESELTSHPDHFKLISVRHNSIHGKISGRILEFSYSNETI